MTKSNSHSVACRIKVIHELQELVEQKERFMSSMSHELRTPLNGIIGLSDALIIGSCGDINERVSQLTPSGSGPCLIGLHCEHVSCGPWTR